MQPEDQRPSSERPRAEYVPPAVTVYGDVRDLTQNRGRNGRVDGGANPNNKSSP